MAATSNVEGVITPSPGGVARSASKVGSRYEGLKASTSDPYCPTLKGRVESQLHKGVNSVLEIVIDGVNEPSVAEAMRVTMETAVGEGIIAISAGNYGGQLGPYHFYLRKLL